MFSENFFNFNTNNVLGYRIFNPFAEDCSTLRPNSADPRTKRPDSNLYEFFHEANFQTGQSIAKPNFIKVQIERQLKDGIDLKTCQKNKTFVKKLVLANPNQAASELVENKNINIEWRIYALSLLSYGWYQQFGSYANDSTHKGFFYKSNNADELELEQRSQQCGDPNILDSLITSWGESSDLYREMAATAINENNRKLISLMKSLEPDVEKYIRDSLNDPDLLEFFVQKNPTNKDSIDHKLKTLFIAALLDSKFKSNQKLFSNDFRFISYLMNDINERSSLHLEENATQKSAGGNENHRVHISKSPAPDNQDFIATIYHELKHQITKKQMGLTAQDSASNSLSELASFLAELKAVSHYDKNYPEQFKEIWNLETRYKEIHNQQNSYTANSHYKALSIIKDLMDIGKEHDFDLAKIFAEELDNQFQDSYKPIHNFDFNDFIAHTLDRVNNKLKDQGRSLKLGIGLREGNLTEEIKNKLNNTFSAPLSFSGATDISYWISKVPIIFEDK